MSRTIQQKQIEYFTKYAGYCLKIWNSIVGQQITHYRHGPGTVVKIRKIKDGICVEVQFAEKPGEINFRLEKIVYYFSRVFTHLTLPREVEKELETRYWDFIKEDLIYELRDLASRPSIDQSTYNTFNEIYDRLMRGDRTRQLSEQDIQKINEYQQKLTDKMICEFRSLVSRPSIDQSTYNTFNEIYDRLMRGDRTRQLPEEIVQEINGYKKKLMDITRFTNLSEKAMNPKVNACFPLPKLNEDDIQLVEKWYPSQEKLDGRSLIDVINDDPKDWDSGRLLSARSAEKIAICFYRHYGKKVKDISITQLNENNNSDWRDYDLNVDGRPIDVKNSRKSQNSEDRYTEYCIPKFKEDRTSQKVIVSGVFSPYLWPFELLGEPKEYHQDREIRFLGETTLEKQQKLKDEFNGDLVYFSEPRSSDKYFLPPWVFDYPEYVYKERDNALNELKDFPNLALLKEVELEFNLIPVGIAVGIDLTEILDNEALDLWEWKFLDQLRNRIMKYKLSLPFLFLTLLSHFIGMASSSKGVSDFNPDKYRKFLFYKGRSNLYKGRSNKPLGIYDPLKTIDALIEALSTLWTADNGLIRKFRVFKLMSFNILQGKSNPNENSWTTLIAYCGGRLQDGSACGKNPLVLGSKAKLCEHGKLKCPECDFCCDKCRGERSPTSFP